MNGLSKKLTSLVEAADDPCVLYYAYTHLGIGLYRPHLGFFDRVKALRHKLFTSWLRSHSIWGKIQKQREQAKRELEETVELNRREQQLALQLFQNSTLHVVARQLDSAKPEELRTHVADKDALVRFLSLQAIGRRHLHLEADLIPRLKDPDSVVREAARAALVRVARGTDFGPIPGASTRSTERAIAKWRHWLALQQRAADTTPSGDTIAAAPKQAKAEPFEPIPLILDTEPSPTLNPAVARLSDELVKAQGDEQRAVLARLRDAKGIDHTDALALAIPQLSGDIQHEARDALTARLTRMTAVTLRDKLQEDNVEVRCAAALACGRKIAKERIPDLLQLLDDPEMDVIQSARAALTELTGEDFGPLRDDDSRRRAAAVTAWRKWWDEHRVK
jgi:HEAT repeat protein